jgi:hypothetical protein
MNTINYNDPKYELLYMVGNEAAPEYDFDDEGNPYQCMSIVPCDFLKVVDKIKFPFTYNDYINNTEIIATLKGFEIDIEQFWFALLFIYHFTQEKCINALTLGETAKVQIQNLKEFSSGIYGFTISADGKKKLVINDLTLINDLKSHLEALLAEQDNGFDSHSINFKRPLNSEPASIQIWYAANRFIELFKALNLPTKRAKDISIEDKIQMVSFNKMFLISQLIYLMKFTNNKSFLIEDNSLKGILKQYKNYKLNTVSRHYLV